jgi:sortase B
LLPAASLAAAKTAGAAGAGHATAGDASSLPSAAAAGAGKKGFARTALRLAHGVVDFALLCLVLLFFAVGGYALWDSSQIYQQADPQRYEIFKPGDEQGNLSFSQLQQINSDVFGWLNVYGTNIDYPLVQSPDNIKYVNTNAKGERSLSGAIFLDSKNSRDLTDFVNLIYGHNMDKEVMFGEIGQFANSDYFAERRFGSLHLGERQYGLEFLVFLRGDAYDDSLFRTDVSGAAEQQDYLQMLYGKALQSRDVELAAADRLVLLTTCSPGPTNRRDVLVARICDDTFADSFAKSGIEAGPVPDALVGIFGYPATWIALALIVAATPVLFVLARRKRKK